MLILRTAIPRWSPSSALLATGSVSAIDESFSSESILEIWAPFDNDTTPLASFSANSTFTSLAWSESTATQAQGVLAAGFDNGEICLFNPEILLAGTGQE